MTVIEISERKYEKLSEHIEEGLRHLGKAMSCLSEIGEPYGFGERGDMERRDGSYGNRSRYDRYDERDERDRYWDEDEMEMGERRRRSRRTGRYY